MKKKVFAALLGASMLVLTGCQNSDMIVLTPYGDAVIKDEGTSSGTAGSNADSNKGEIPKESESVPQGGQGNSESNSGAAGDSGLIHVGFAQVGSESGWRLAQTASMKSTFTAENGYQFDFVDCNNDQQAQISALEKFVSDGVDYIVLDPIVVDGYDSVLQKAKDAGIPVIVVDRNISADPSLYTCWVGSDFTKEGNDAAAWLDGYLNDAGRASEEINILTILGSDGASATNGRTKGFEDYAANMGNWKLLDKQTGDFTQDGGKAVMSAYLKQYDDIDVVVCQNDDEAFGAIEAIQEAGLTCGPNGDIIMISFDATKAAFERMIAGEIHVDVECNPLEGPLVAEIIQTLESGGTVEAIQYVEEGVYPADTAADIIDSRAY